MNKFYYTFFLLTIFLSLKAQNTSVTVTYQEVPPDTTVAVGYIDTLLTDSIATIHPIDSLQETC